MTMLCHRWRMAITLDREPRRKVSGKDIPPTHYVRPGEPTPLQTATNKRNRTHCSLALPLLLPVHDKQGPTHGPRAALASSGLHIYLKKHV